MTVADAGTDYVLSDQVGFILRQVHQRHAAIFAEAFGDEFTPTQWAVLAKLAERGECSQNLLGRLVSMDVATVKGVVDRLTKRGLAATRPDGEDRRRVLVASTVCGLDVYRAGVATAAEVTENTLDPLAPEERRLFLSLLRRLR